MRRCLIFILFLTIGFSLQAQENEEFRATWVVDFHWLVPGNSVEENKALTRQILDNHVAANMTSVLWQVRRFGSVYYPSAIEPWGPQANFQDPGYDPVAYAIEQAHLRGLEFHAWFNTFESRFRYTGSPSHLHPEWICRDQDNLPMPDEIAWLSPGLAEVRSYLRNVAMEIVNNYDIDGLHLDFVRWNEHSNSGLARELARDKLQQGLPDGIITEAQAQDLLQNAAGRYLYDVEHPFSAGVPPGFNSWEEWWRWSVTEFVRTLQDSIKAVKPWVRLSPAALGRYNWGGWQGFDIVYQDAALWLNEGYIDQLVGMHYHWSTPGAIYDVLEGGCPQCWSDFIQPAIQAGRLYSVGLFSDSFDENNIFGRHPAIVDTVRSVPWADGFQFFSYRSWKDHNYWQIAREQFFTRKAKIRATGLLDDVPPPPPAIALNQLDSLHYEINVTPAAGTAENHWFAVYRSEDANPDPDNDEIIRIAFGTATFTVTDGFDGLQDYNGSYTYFATQIDRFWNESGPSNGQTGDPVPSFAPTVVASFPAAGDTIPVNANLSLTFSKTMDTATLAGAISLDPPATLGALSWSADRKTVTVPIVGDLVFATHYTLTVAATATDVNGRALDGNGDGSEGDDFQLTFMTLEMDNVGPRVVQSFPDANLPAEDFTIDDVLTIVFDEFVDKNSLTETSISLTQNGMPVAKDYLVSDLAEHSLLSIQSDEPLIPNQDYTLTLSTDITDTLGNPMAADFSLNFHTSGIGYSAVTMIEDFRFPGEWWQPSASGSTVGINAGNTSFGFQTVTVLPVPRPKKAAQLNYEWDPAANAHLLREYLAGGTPRNVLFDSTYVLQCYVFGDGSRNLFRFAIDDNVPAAGAENHEVSKWIPIDWVGWRLVEWQLNDPGSVGEWLGDGILEGTLRFDSFQLTYDPENGAIGGTIYFDDLRLVKKVTVPVGIDGEEPAVPAAFRLYQNYPNPFNPATTIAFDLPVSGRVRLKIYDTLGREVATLLDDRLPAGRHRVNFDAGALASGIYLYRLSSGLHQLTRRMLLVK